MKKKQMAKTKKKLPKQKKLPRVNLSKDQLLEQQKFQQKVQHLKDLVRKLFPELETVDTVYDAQTVVNALAGFIDNQIEETVKKIKLSDIKIDLSKETDSKIKTAILNIEAMFQDEPAQELSESLERLGQTFSKHAADKFLRQPMSTLSVDDIVQK